MRIAAVLLFCAVLFFGEGIAAERFIYESGDRRDPFVPLLRRGVQHVAGLEGISSSDDIRLEGIIYDPSGESMVVLNGVILKEGDRTSNIAIGKIMERSAVVYVSGKPFIIKLMQE